MRAKANAKVRAAKEELAQILVKRDPTLAKARELRASLAASKASEVSSYGSSISTREASRAPANGLVASVARRDHFSSPV